MFRFDELLVNLVPERDLIFFFKTSNGQLVLYSKQTACSPFTSSPLGLNCAGSSPCIKLANGLTNFV